MHALVTDHLDAIDARDVNSIEIPGVDGIVLRVGRYGPFLQRGEERASVPEDLAPDELTREKAEELLAKPSGDRELGADPVSGRQIVAREGRYGPYVSEVVEEGSADKPRTGSLFKTMSLDTITLEDALRLLTLPRTIEASDSEEIVVANGRYGPFIKKGKETRSLADEEQLFTITKEQAEALLAQPKERRGRGQAKPPLQDLGPDPASGRPIVVKEGRFGPYVTDGETNASLRRGDDATGAHDGSGARAPRRTPGQGADSEEDASHPPASADAHGRRILYPPLVRRARVARFHRGIRAQTVSLELVTAELGFQAGKTGQTNIESTEIVHIGIRERTDTAS